MYKLFWKQSYEPRTTPKLVQIKKFNLFKTTRVNKSIWTLFIYVFSGIIKKVEKVLKSRLFWKYHKESKLNWYKEF